MLTVEACLKRSQELNDISDSARLDIELMLQNILKKNRAYLYAWPEKTLSESQKTEFESCIQRRLSGEPIAHIVGAQGFWTLDLDVSPCTLIPRPETELLVELALDRTSDESHILDLGTGTGAIALALASEISTACIHAVDLNEEAVLLAKKNAKKHRLEKVKIYQSHWFDQVTECFDLIVSNPPYIEESDPHLAQGDVQYEPRSALVSGKDGLDDIRIICREAKKYLFEGGVLMLEHGWKQGASVAKEFAVNGFQEIKTYKDFGRRDRVTLGRHLS